MWRLIVDPPGGAAANMAEDERLALEACAGADPTLRVYGWSEPAISLGRRQKSDSLPAELLRRQMPVVSRPTGGGAVVHTVQEFTYSLSVPAACIPAGISLPALPCRLHAALRRELISRLGIPEKELSLAQGNSPESAADFLICFAAPVKGDLLYRGNKAAGAALRRWKGGLLIQGSIQGLPADKVRLLECVESAATWAFGGEGKNCAEGEI